jgi:hypothetical protein
VAEKSEVQRGLPYVGCAVVWDEGCRRPSAGNFLQTPWGIEADDAVVGRRMNALCRCQEHLLDVSLMILYFRHRATIGQTTQPGGSRRGANSPSTNLKRRDGGAPHANNWNSAQRLKRETFS